MLSHTLAQPQSTTTKTFGKIDKNTMHQKAVNPKEKLVVFH